MDDDLIEAPEAPTEIVVPVGDGPGARRAVAPAARLARTLHLRIHLLTVVPLGASSDWKRRRLDDLDELRRAVERIYPEIRPVHTRLVEHQGLVDALRDEYPSGLIVLGTERAVHGVLEASIADVVRRLPASRSLVIVGPGVDPGWRPGPVVVTLDGSPTAEAALQPAIGWAALLRAPLVALQALPLSVGAHLEAREGHIDGATNYLRRIADDLRGRGVDARGLLVHHDDPVTAVVEYLHRHECALAVMATHAHRGLPRAALGSVTLGVTAASPCPVRVVRAPATQLALPSS